jgi:HK97 family phage portal protein
MASILDRLTAAFDAFKRGEPLMPGALQPPQRSAIGGYISFPGWDQINRDALNQSQNDQMPARTAMTSYLVYRAVNAIAQEASASVLQVVKRVSEDEEEVENHPFEVRWESPNPYMGRSFLLQYWTFQLLLTGEAYFYIIPGANGIAELWPVPSWFIAPKPDPKLFIDGYLWQPDPQRAAIPIPKEYIVYSRLPNPFDLRRGLSPLASIMTEVEGDIAMARWNRAFFAKENAIPSGLISVPRDTLDTDMQRIRQEIFDFFGSGNRRIAVARSGDIEWKEFGRSQKDMEFLNGRQFTERAVLTAFGIPEGYFAKDATRANSEGAKATFIENAVWPKLVMLAEDLNSQMIDRYYPGHRAVFEDIRPRNRAIELQEFTTLSTVLTVDELRARFKYDALGDVRGLMLLTEVQKQQPIISTPADAAVQQAAVAKEEAAGPEPMTDKQLGDMIEKRVDDEERGAADAQLEAEMEEEGMKAELRRWERKALKAFKARGRAAVGFESDVIDADVAAEISTGLKSVSSAEGVRSVFAPFTKTVDVSEMTPAERRIYRNVQKVLRASRDPMAAAILAEEPVDITQMSAELRAALEPVLVEAYVERFTALAQTAPPAIDIPAAGTFAADWAKLYTFDLVRGISTTTAKILQDAVATFMATPGMTRRELEALIEPAFGRRRASLIAVTEATRAAQAATVQTQTILRNAGYPTTRIWRTLNDELVCKVCGPQNGKEEARWTAPEPPAHPGCRCSTTLEFIG